MAKREILAGVADQTIDVFIMDSSSTVGAGLAGLAYNSSGLKCYYRKGATGSATALTLATQTVGGAHSDGGFVEIDATNMKGVYRLDLSDTIVGTAGMVTIYLYGATNMAPVAIEIEVVSVNKFDAVRMGMTALPNAAADAAGGLPISDAGGLDLDAQIKTDIDNLVTRLGTPSDLGGGATVAANLADIEAQTDDIGAAGAGLTNLPWNAAWDAEVQSEATDALNAYDPPTKAELDSAVAALALEATAQSILTDTAEIGSAGAGLTSIPDSSGVTTLLSRLSATRAGYLDKLLYIAAAVQGKSAGNGTGTVTYYDDDGSTARLVVTINGSNERTGVTRS